MTDTSEELHRKYRPQKFKDIVGQDSVVKSLDGLFKSGKVPHVFLFTGGSGVGKTTLGRILAKKLKCTGGGLIEIDAASNTGIDAMRSLTNSVRYKGFGDRDTKVVILDECFTEGTLVSAPGGSVPIASLKVGDVVHNAAGVGTVLSKTKKTVELSRLVSVQLTNGTSLFCSDNHKFLTSAGWVEAAHLNKESLIYVPEDISSLSSTSVEEGALHIYVEDEYRARFEKNKEARRVGVERVTRYEQGCICGTFSGVVSDSDKKRGAIDLFDIGVSNHPSFYAGGTLVHNCHALTRQSWQSLLKDLEDTPEHVYYVLCTTELDKVPKTIKTRAHHYNLADVRHDDLIDLLVRVSEAEDIDLSEKLLSIIAREAEGSPRMALVNLSMCREAEDADEIRSILKSAEGTKEFYDLARTLVSAKPQGMKGFNICKEIVASIDAPPETMRLSLTSYVTKCLAGKNARNTEWLLHLLNCLQGGPYNPSEKIAPILVFLGDVYLGE